MFEIIVVTILLSTVLNLLLKTVKIPIIIGYIITGIIIAYLFGLHDVQSNHELNVIAEFGIVFLMFTVGLEFSVRRLFKMKKNVFIYGGAQIFVTALIFYFISYYFLGFDVKTSIIIGLGLSLSSTAIVLKILNESHDINKEYGHKSLGVLLFQDLAVIPIFLMIGMFSNNSTSVGLLLTETLISTIVLIFGLWILGRYILNGFLEKISNTNSSELFISAVLLIVLGSSYLSFYLGLSYSLGALIAGILIAETHYKHQVEADLSPFRDLLLGLFFITVGMQLNFAVIVDNIFYIAIFLPLIILIKFLVIFFIIKLSSKKRTAFKTALSLFQVGEFAIVVFELAKTRLLIDNNLVQILIVIIIISMILTPFILKNIGAISNFLSNYLFKYKNIDIIEKTNDNILNDDDIDIILIGYGRLGKVISKILDQQGYNYVIIERDYHTFKNAKKDGKPIIFGNAHQKHLLKSLNISNASNIIISVGNNEKLYLICEAVTSIAKDSNIIVKVNKNEEKEMLSKLNNLNLIVETEETAISMLKQID